MTPPDAGGPDPKEVFAFFGLAAYHGQVLEQELITFAMVLHLSGQTRVSRDDVMAVSSTLAVRTLGLVFREARTLTAVPPDLELKLVEALRRRSDLARRFFARRSEDLMSEDGRADMIEELGETTALFEDVDAVVTAVREQLSARLDVSQEAARKELDEMLGRPAASDRGA
jgi:hypothetical protein